MTNIDYSDCLWFGGCNGLDLLLWLYCFWLSWALAVLIPSYVVAAALAIMSLLPDYGTTWPRTRQEEEEEILRQIARGDRWRI